MAVLYNYKSGQSYEQLQHSPASWQKMNGQKQKAILFGHWVVNGGSIAVRFVVHIVLKLQVWLSDSAHIDLNKEPLFEKTFYISFKKVELTTTNGNTIVVDIIESQDNILKWLPSCSLHVIFNGRKLDDKDTPLPLHWACANDHVLEVEQLIKNGENIDARDNEGRTPLLDAIRCGHSDDIIKLLIDNKANVNVRDSLSETPLHWACANDRVNVAMMLIEKGANVNAKNNRGMTPLHCASMRGQDEWVKLFIEKGADVEAQDDNGKTPQQLIDDLVEEKKNGTNNLARELAETAAKGAATQVGKAIGEAIGQALVGLVIL